jgi:2-dehydropantoate 2-reductase
MDIMIIGGGAVGLLSAVFLKQAGCNVMIRTRTEKQAEAINEDGLKMDGEIWEVKASTDSSSWKPEAVIIAVKQYHLEEILNSNIPAEVPWLFIQNGMGHTELAEKFHSAPLFSIVTHGAVRKGPAEVMHTGSGKFIIGGSMKSGFIEMLEKTGAPMNAEWTDNIQLQLKKKLLVNAVVNPLTVLYETRNGYLLDNTKAKEEAYKLFEEAAEVLNMPKSSWAFVEEIIKNTKLNYSSMLMDYKKGRALELESINGWIIKEGTNQNIAVSENLRIVEAVKNKVSSRVVCRD